MQKFALLNRQTPFEWVSCQSISTNLEKAYSLAAGSDLIKVTLNPSDSLYDMRQAARTLYQAQPEKIFFIDHAFHPGNFLRSLSEVAPHYHPEIYIHVFGDFILNTTEWLGCEDILNRFPLRFICASKKQENLVRKFVDGTPDLVSVVPFPVDEALFHPNLEKRDLLRSQLSLKSNETVFLYTGRLSQQKNVLALIRAFDSFQRDILPNSKLLLAGPVDDLGVPYLGKKSPPGIMAYDLQNVIHDLFKDSRREVIRYLGDLNSQALNDVYNAADIFVSLSTHNDEDYGMSPAEALMTGCHCVLSNWGGYTNFADIAQQAVTKVTVKMEARANLVDPREVVKGLMKAAGAVDLSQRLKVSEEAKKYLSLSAVRDQVSLFLHRKNEEYFEDFTPLFRQLGQAFKQKPHSPFSSGRQYSTLYKEIYDVYGN